MNSDLQSTSTSDHDILIQLNVNVSSLRDEMRQSYQDMLSRNTDHEVRIRTIEGHNERLDGGIRTLKWLVGSLGIIAGVIEPILSWYIATHK